MHDLQALGLAARAIVLSGLNPGQVAYLLARCRLCVQPSLSESFPLAVLEAGAAGAVVVASRIPGHEEIIKEGVTGFMFTPRDPAQCAAAIERALADKHRARGFADALRSDVLKRFTWSGCSEAYRRLVDSDRHG
jgi:glycosyltransferase involved in cell wall biosynthesis